MHEDYAVRLTYTDLEGDKVKIGSNGELVDAIQQFEPGSVKITAQVQRKPNQPHAAFTRATETSTQTSQASLNTSATQTAVNLPGGHIHQVVDGVVAVLGATVMALQNGVQTVATNVAAAREQAATRSGEFRYSTAFTDAPNNNTSEPSGDNGATPFVHGRHTCDLCGVTPIIGKRYHATNLPDYDLCEKCRDDYKGEEIKFVAVELGEYFFFSVD